jgi:tRNA pseudouridine38-40 synthase
MAQLPLPHRPDPDSYRPRVLLKLEPMREAASFIVGDHSFRSFAHSSEEEPHYLSTVYRAEWQVNHPYLEFHIEANRFLHGMVRLLVGTFVDVGRGKIAASRVREILQARDVRLAGPKAPACGLTLVAVGYEPWSSDRRN